MRKCGFGGVIGEDGTGCGGGRLGDGWYGYGDGKLGGGSKSSSREGSFRARNRATAATPPSPAVSEPVGGRENDEGGSFGRVSPKSRQRWATGTPNSATPGSTPGSTTPSRYGSVNAEGWSVLERASRQAASRQPP